MRQGLTSKILGIILNQILMHSSNIIRKQTTKVQMQLHLLHNKKNRKRLQKSREQKCLKNFNSVASLWKNPVFVLTKERITIMVGVPSNLKVVLYKRAR